MPDANVTPPVSDRLTDAVRILEEGRGPIPMRLYKAYHEYLVHVRPDDLPSDAWRRQMQAIHKSMRRETQLDEAFPDVDAKPSVIGAAELMDEGDAIDVCCEVVDLWDAVMRAEKGDAFDGELPLQ